MTVTCLRCGRPMLKERQGCYPNGKLFRFGGCTADEPETHVRCFKANGVYINNARWPMHPIRLPVDPYAQFPAISREL